MHFLSARTRTCRLSVHALRAVAQRRRLRGTRAVIDVHCMCRCCPSAHCACQPHHRPAPTAVAVRRSRCCMVACVHAMHTGLTPLRASRQRPIGKAKRRRGRTGRRTPAEETEVTSRTSQRRRGRAGDGECDHLDAVPNVTSHPHMSRQPPFDIRRSDASDPPLSCLAAEGRSARERHHVSLLPSPGAHPSTRSIRLL